MSPHALYPYFNFGILAPWALLVFAPRWRWTHVAIHSALVPVVLCTVHAAMFVTLSAQRAVPDGAGGASLEAAMRMFDVPWLALLCWIHYLAFDLFVGGWIARDGRRRGISHWLVAPCLVTTMFLGPTGLLLYLVVRAASKRALALVEEIG